MAELPLMEHSDWSHPGTPSMCAVQQVSRLCVRACRAGTAQGGARTAYCDHRAAYDVDMQGPRLDAASAHAGTVQQAGLHTHQLLLQHTPLLDPPHE